MSDHPGVSCSEAQELLDHYRDETTMTTALPADIIEYLTEVGESLGPSSRAAGLLAKYQPVRPANMFELADRNPGTELCYVRNNAFQGWQYDTREGSWEQDSSPEGVDGLPWPADPAQTEQKRLRDPDIWRRRFEQLIENLEHNQTKIGAAAALDVCRGYLAEIEDHYG